MKRSVGLPPLFRHTNSAVYLSLSDDGAKALTLMMPTSHCTRTTSQQCGSSTIPRLKAVCSFDRSFVVNTFIQFRVLRCGSIFIVPCCGEKSIKSNEIGMRKLSGFVFYCISFQFSLIQTVVVDDIIKNDSCFGRFRTYQFCT